MISILNNVLSIFSNRSYGWKIIREKHLSKENFCQACKTSKNLQVHHIVPISVDSSLELQESNLITLCSRCHLLFGHLMNYKSWNPEVKKDCANIREKIENRSYID